MDDAALVAWRTRSQRLADRPDAGAAAVAAHVVGVQAQEPAATRLAVRVRSATATSESVTRAYADGSVVRTWLMRGTLHAVAAADVRWMLALLGARNAAAGARRRHQLGLDERTCARALDAIARVLAAETPLTRAQLVDRLAAQSVPIDPAGQAPAHLMSYAAALGLICRGPDLDRGEPGYVLLDEWVPAAAPLEPDAALAELARRYVAAFGPAGPRDLAAWSGLPAGQAARGFAMVADELVEAAPGAFVAAGSAAASPSGSVRLVGAFDTYLLGYRSREPALAPAYARRIQAGGGIVHPAVLLDGRVVGTWRLRRRGDAEVTVEPFGALDSALRPAIEADVADIGRFLGVPARLSR